MRIRFEFIHPLRGYAKEVKEFIGERRKDIFIKLGNLGVYHFFSGEKAFKFALCTKETYNKLIEFYSIDDMNGFKPYSHLKMIDNQYKDTLPKKTFNLPQGKKHKSNVLHYRKDYDGHHPTQKPVALLKDLIETYSNEGDLVLDFTAGSFSTGVACKRTNRRFIGIEQDKGYFDIGVKRMMEAL